MTELITWLHSPQRRVFPRTVRSDGGPGIMQAARGERIAFQVAIRNMNNDAVDVEVAVRGGSREHIRVRRAGYVLMRHLNPGTHPGLLEDAEHLPGLTPDPLFDESQVTVGPNETVTFWVDVTPAPMAAPDHYALTIEVKAAGELVQRLGANYQIFDLPGGMPLTLPVTHWIYPDAILDWYGLKAFEERFWQLAERFLTDAVSHGNSCIYVPIFTPPTDGVKRPCQLLGVQTPQADQYRFDFSLVDRWVDLAEQAGARWFEWTHLFSQWGVKHALRVYRNNEDDQSLLWPADTGATAPVYRQFLQQFLPAFETYLSRRGLADRSFFHLSDEPHGDEHLAAYRAARDMLRELAPWMRVMDALSDIRYGREGLTDIPVPVISSASEYKEAGIPCWVYFCCGPRGPYVNRVMDTPLAVIRTIGWLLYALDAKGFLHWGYNYWQRSQQRTLVDPFLEQSAGAWPGWPYGDPFQVYPGPDGPIDSIRWEVFSLGLQDYGLLERMGVNRTDPELQPLQGYDRYPRDPGWISMARRHLMER